MFKKICFTVALLFLSNSAFAACTNPLVIKDGSAANISMSMTSNADGFCQYNFNMAQINGVVPLMGNGVTGTGSPRVTIASDNTAFPVNAVQSGTWTVQPGNTANTTPWLVTVNNTLTAVTPGDGITTTIYGTAPASPVIGVPLLWNGTTYDRQKSAGATGVAAVRQTDGTNVGQLDPCQSEVKSTLPITLATAAVKVIAVGVSAKKIYVCQIHLTNNAADSVAVFEATTATTCATSPVAVVGAGTSVATAATGYNFAANGGISLGSGSNQILQTSVNANDLCIAQSAATQLTGSITYVTR